MTSTSTEPWAVILSVNSLEPVHVLTLITRHAVSSCPYYRPTCLLLVMDSHLLKWCLHLHTHILCCHYYPVAPDPLFSRRENTDTVTMPFTVISLVSSSALHLAAWIYQPPYVLWSVCVCVCVYWKAILLCVFFSPEQVVCSNCVFFCGRVLRWRVCTYECSLCVVT